MAFESSNRSPSPMSTRPNPNPNFTDSRNQSDKRGDGGVRRSFSGSPFSKPSIVAHRNPWSLSSKTPANSPAENPRRNSFSKETATMGLSRDGNEHKENSKPNANLKPLRGTKNFMSPTISAVSKATPSPRKKVLAERNEAVRTSASLSDGKFLFFAAADGDLKGETDNGELHKELVKKEETHLSACESKKRVTFDDDVVVLSPEVISRSDANDEPFESLCDLEMTKPNDFAEDEVKEPWFDDVGKDNNFVSSPSAIAPFDADPFALPYDPKTNYLSPRPQFLRYKPHPEIALYLKNHQPTNLEDSFSSNSCFHHDAESNVEEVQSEELPVQEEVLGSSFSSSSVVEEVMIESSDDSAQAHQNKEASVESEVHLKPRFFTGRRMITWILLLGVVAFLSSMIVSQSSDNIVVSSSYQASYQALSKIYQYNHPIKELARAEFSGLLQSMRTSSVDYLPLMIFSFRGTDSKFNPSRFLNFSALECPANDHFIEGRGSGFPGGELELLTGKRKGLLEAKTDTNSEEVALLQSSELPEQLVQYHEQTGQIKPDYSGEDEFIETSNDIESQPNMEANREEVEVQRHPQLEQDELLNPDDPKEEPLRALPVMSPHLDIESQHDSKADGQPVSDFSEQIQEENEAVLDDLEEPSSDNTLVESSKTKGPMLEESFTVEGSPETHHQSTITILVASLCLAIVVSSFAMLAKSIPTEQAEMTMKKEKASFYGNPSSHGSPLEVVDLDGETCPSDSFSFYDKKAEARGSSEREAQSKEERKQPRRNYKRESLASSSSEYTMGSSYGSFTTYSIIPTKHGDEEVVTPVRRSSRIRKQVTSP